MPITIVKEVMFMEQINVNLIPNGIKPICHVSQYDSGREIRLNLFDGTDSFTLTGTETIEFDVKKSDGTVYTTEITNTEDDYLIITTTSQMCAAVGENICSVKIVDGEISIGTINLILDVEPSPLDNGLTSASYVYDLRQQIEDIISHMPPQGGGVEGLKFDVKISEYTTV